MKTKQQKRNDAISRMEKEIKEIEAKPEDQRNDYRLKHLKWSVEHLKSIR